MLCPMHLFREESDAGADGPVDLSVIDLDLDARVSLAEFKLITSFLDVDDTEVRDPPSAPCFHPLFSWLF